MIISKILSKYQITLPKEAVKALHLEKGSYLKCIVQNGAIFLAPVVVEDVYSSEELESFERLYSDPKNKGKVYHSKGEALEHLKGLK